ncbi:MAG: efflux RND transporter periplasmic adaptor subunit [Wenzhouxiangella sp.]|nr:efflux RND transporter periplasmic adaptor subunit [Wenzhouxiangella sp.]
MNPANQRLTECRFGRWVSMVVLTVAALATTPAQAQADWVAVERAMLQEEIRLDGRIEAVQQSTVSAQISGTITALPVDVDDVVSQGDVIAQLDDTEPRAQLDQAQANLTEAEASLLDATQRVERIRPLAERGVASQAELDQAENQLNAAQARLERARAAVEQAQEQLSYTRVVAPYGGIVTERHVELGETVSPSTPLLSGFSLEALRVVVSIPQRYADLARQQRRALVTLNDGRVLRTDEMTFFPYADTDTHAFRVRMALSEVDGELFPGMLVRVGLPVGEREALWIPEEALVRRGELRGVYVLDDNDQQRLRQIRTGLRRDGQIEVLAGLSEGERVALRGGQ